MTGPLKLVNGVLGGPDNHGRYLVLLACGHSVFVYDKRPRVGRQYAICSVCHATQLYLGRHADAAPLP
jgi:hypothetical protein